MYYIPGAYFDTSLFKYNTIIFTVYYSLRVPTTTNDKD